LIGTIQRKMGRFRAWLLRAWNRRRLRNPNPTLLCNNCTGAVILHDLGLRFNTPTVNLWIDRMQFLRWVRHLEHYLDCDVIEAPDAGADYPVGVLKSDLGDVTIYFQHYPTFEEARRKWLERSRRIDLGNLYVLLDAGPRGTHGPELLAEFESLPHRNKVVLTDGPCPEVKDSFGMSFYGDAPQPGMILQYDGFTGRRFLDEFDYTAFLNRPPG
jgi:uncharacterized protein (DUF1919 family)